MEYIHKFIRFLVGYFQRNSTLDTICEHYSHISFDIFDTLIERKCRNPKEVFSLVEQRYNQTAKVEIHGFKELRQNAEKLARRNTPNEEVTLDDIYQNIAEIYGVNASNLLKDLEIKVELEQCVAINPNVMLYNKCVDDQNKKVYITSDMYLPKEVIIDILQRNGIKMPQHLYISCEAQKTKHSGSLFRLLLSENNIAKHTLVHVGDHPVSDYLMAKVNGIHSYLIL